VLDVRKELNRDPGDFGLRILDCGLNDDTEIVSESKIDNPQSKIAYWWGLWAPGRLDRVLEALS
jgi:hypothetical protein